MSGFGMFGGLFWARVLRARVGSQRWLLERANARDPVVLAEVCRRYRARVYAHCVSRLGDTSLAEEAAQETLARCLDAHPATSDDLPQWILGLADDACAEAGSAPAQLASSDSDDPQAQLWRQRRERSVALTLARMRPRYRTSLILSQLFGLSSIEVSDAFGTQPGAAEDAIVSAERAFCRLYPDVSHLPMPCAAAFPHIYRQNKATLNDAQKSQLDAHIAACPHCRNETEWTEKRQILAAALPLLAAVGRRVETARLPELVTALGPVFTGNPHKSVPIASRYSARAAAGALAVAACLVLPAAALVADYSDTDTGSPRVVSSTSHHGNSEPSATARRSDRETPGRTKRSSAASRKSDDAIRESATTRRARAAGRSLRQSVPAAAQRSTAHVDERDRPVQPKPRRTTSKASEHPSAIPVDEPPTGDGKNPPPQSQRPDKPDPPDDPGDSDDDEGDGSGHDRDDDSDDDDSDDDDDADDDDDDRDD